MGNKGLLSRIGKSRIGNVMYNLGMAAYLSLGIGASFLQSTDIVLASENVGFERSQPTESQTMMSHEFSDENIRYDLMMKLHQLGISHPKYIADNVILDPAGNPLVDIIENPNFNNYSNKYQSPGNNIIIFSLESEGKKFQYATNYNSELDDLSGLDDLIDMSPEKLIDTYNSGFIWRNIEDDPVLGPKYYDIFRNYCLGGEFDKSEDLGILVFDMAERLGIYDRELFMWVRNIEKEQKNYKNVIKISEALDDHISATQAYMDRFNAYLSGTESNAGNTDLIRTQMAFDSLANAPEYLFTNFKDYLSLEIHHTMKKNQDDYMNSANFLLMLNQDNFKDSIIRYAPEVIEGLMGEDESVKQTYLYPLQRTLKNLEK